MTYSHGSLKEILSNANAEKDLDMLVDAHLDKARMETADEIIKVYREFFNSPQAKSYVTIFPGVRGALIELRKAGFDLAIFTNASRASVNRDLSGLGLESFQA